jgi:hypothetical protein
LFNLAPAAAIVAHLSTLTTSKNEAVGTTRSTISAEVVNGCGKKRFCAKVTDHLRANAVDVVQTPDNPCTEHFASLVIDRTGNLANAKKVAGILGLDSSRIITVMNKSLLLDVSVLVGNDFENYFKENMH